MKALGGSGPIVVCLEPGQDSGPLVDCGIALARLLNVSLHLAVLLVLPEQRSLDLSHREEQEAETVLDAAAGLARERDLAPTEEIWVARHWKEAVHGIAEELSASAVVIAWRASGPLNLFDVGRTLLRAIPCPVIMVGQAPVQGDSPRWPPHWLAEAQL